MDTIQDFINQLQQAVDLHADGAVKKPMTMNSKIMFVDGQTGDEISVSIDARGGNFFDPVLVVTVY